MQLFFSRVSAEFEFVDRFFASTFGHLPQFRLITQQKIEDNLTGWHTLDKLYDELQKSEVVVHLIGAQVGARPKRPEDIIGFLHRQPLLQSWLTRHRLDPAHWSYTQWEGMLAAFLQEHDPTRQIYLARPANPLITEADEWQDQQGHESRLRAVSRYAESIAASDLRRWVQTLFNHLRANTALISAARQCLHRQSIQEDFKGREEALLDIAARLPPGQSAQVVIFSGAGRGKTCLAVEYAYRHQAQYNSLLLVRCDDKGALAASLADLARCLKLAAVDDPDTHAEQLARHWLRDIPGWLLIVDNIDDAAGRDAALALLRDLGQGHTLITSRDRRWPSSVSAFKLDELSPAAAASLLLAPGAEGQVRGTHPEAVALANDLGRVANVLVQARAYMRARDVSIADYRTRWQNAAQRRRLLHEHDETVCGYPKSAAHTWLTTWEALSVPARVLLNIWSWLSSAPVPREDWPALVGIVPNLPDLDAIECAVGELRRFCLLSPVDDGHAMHATDQLIAKDDQLESDESLPALVWAWQWVLAVVDSPSLLPGHRYRQERQWRSHYALLLANPHRAAVPQAMQIQMVLFRGAVAQREYRLDQARDDYSYVEAIHRALAEGAPDNDAYRRDWSISLNNLGRVAENKNQLDAARSAFAQAEAISRALSESEPNNDAYRRDWSISLENLGRVAEKKNQLDAARSAFAQAEAIRRTLAEGAPDNDTYRRDWSISLENLGRVAENKNQLDAARSAFAQAEAISRALAEGAPDNDAYRRDWSISLENLGRVAEKKNQLDAARSAFAQAEAIRRALAEGAPDNDAYRRDWSISLENLGRVAEKKNQLDAARSAFAQAEAIRRALAEGAPDNDAYRRDWSISLNNLGRVAENKNQLDAARSAFAQAEAISRALAEGAPDNDAYRRDWSISLENLGRVAEKKNQLDAARSAFAQAEAIRRALAEGAPDNDAYRRDWAISLLNLSRVAADADSAFGFVERGAQRMRELVQNQPGEEVWREELVRHWLQRLYTCARDSGRRQQVREVLAEIETHLDVLQSAGRTEFVEEMRDWVAAQRRGDNP